MVTSLLPLVLGSRSPRRRELLGLLVGEQQIIVRPPLDPTEPPLSNVANLQELRHLLSQIARIKGDDVLGQLRTDGTLAGVAGVLTADTVIVGTRSDGRPVVLGQPPESEGWQETVRQWFNEFYFGRAHQAMTAVCLTLPDETRVEQVVATTVHFRDDSRQWLTWYLATGEPLGKAGGYGLQGAGSLFVDRIDGSPSNVIGLPLHETAEMLSEIGVELPPRKAVRQQ